MNDCIKRNIFAFVGPSKAGKTTLIRAMAAAFPDDLEEALSITTRPPRGPKDAKTYLFITFDGLRVKEADGKLVQMVEYAGHLYANDRDEIDQLLKRHHALIALTEQGVRNFLDAGYEVVVIRIRPNGHARTDNAERKQADAEREKLKIPVHIDLLNSFAPSGLDRAIQELTRMLRLRLSKSPT